MKYPEKLCLTFSFLLAATAACGSSSKSEPSDDAAAANHDAGIVGDGGSASGTATSFSGKLGVLGDVKPTQSSWVVSNSGETLIYFSSAPLTCAMLQTMGVGWLSSVPGGAQVIEVVVKGDPKVGTVAVGSAELNYAPGGMSSAHEKSAASGNIVFTAAAAKGPVSGSLSANFSDGTQISGPFAADFCPNGSQY